MAGISISHLEKIETGARLPGIETYQRLLRFLDAVVKAGKVKKKGLYEYTMLMKYE